MTRLVVIRYLAGVKLLAGGSDEPLIALGSVTSLLLALAVMGHHLRTRRRADAPRSRRKPVTT